MNNNNSVPQEATIYNMATLKMAQKRQWSSGETLTLMDGQYQGRKAIIILRQELNPDNMAYYINLYFWRSGPEKHELDKAFSSQPFSVGFLALDEAGKRQWVQAPAATLDAYLAWNARTKEAMQ